MHQPLVLLLMVLTPEDVSKVCAERLHFNSVCPELLSCFPDIQVRFGALTGQSVLVLRLLRDAFGVTFKVKQDTNAVPLFKDSDKIGALKGLQETKQKKRKSSELEDSGDDVSEESGSRRRDGSEDSDASEDDDISDNEHSNGSGDGSDTDDMEEDEVDEDDDDASGSEEEREEDDVHNDSDEEMDGEGHESSMGMEQNNIPSSRTTVLLSCYGIGYSNMFRKAT